MEYYLAKIVREGGEVKKICKGRGVQVHPWGRVPQYRNGRTFFRREEDEDGTDLASEHSSVTPEQ